MILARAGRIGFDSPGNITRLQELLAAIRKIRLEAWTGVSSALREQLHALSLNEASILGRITQTAAPVRLQLVSPEAKALRSIVADLPFEGMQLREWIKGMAADDMRRVHAAIQAGAATGYNARQLVARALGNSGATQATRNAVDSVVRTAVMHVANHTRDAFVEGNASVLADERYVAMLDGKTTAECRAHSGKIFPVGKGPRPPLHMRCRSFRTPAFRNDVLADKEPRVNVERQLLQEFTEARGMQRVSRKVDLPRASRPAYEAFARRRLQQIVGPTPAATTYQQWLQRQTRQFQEETLGVTKARLFREGKLRLDQFVAENGSELTLAQLARNHAAAFKAAGLDPEFFKP